MTPEERAQEQAESEALTRQLKERIEYHEARLAEQDRSDAPEPDAA